MKKIRSVLLIVFGSIVTLVSCETQLDETLNEDSSNNTLLNNSNLLSQKSSAQSLSILTITNGMTFSQLNAVLNTAVSGDIVEVEAGTYQISGKLNLKSGVTLRKQTSTSPIFDARTTSPSELLQQYWTSNNNDIDIFGITFYNIRFNIQNASNTKLRYCIFDYGKRKANTDKGYTSDAYINFIDCTNMIINNCVLKRRNNDSGRGVYTVRCQNTDITNNTFGDGGTTGYFVTSINDNSNGTLIKGNTIKRNASWVNVNETDHGIYSHSFNGLTITENTISGWPTEASGGSIKARNGQNLTITYNTMTNSGILLYVYSNNPTNPFLKNVIIENNTINVTSSTDDLYHGIGYWRNTSDPDFTEYSIRIANNSLPNGRIKIGTPVVASSFNANSGGVFNNDINAITLPTGIANSGNY